MTKTTSHILHPISHTASLHALHSRTLALLPTNALRRTAYVGLSATLIATASIPVLPAIFPVQEVQAAWYNEDWRYRAPVDITSPTTQTNVYMSLTLDTSNTNKFNPDCSDLRFVTRSGQLIPHHITSGCGSGSTQIQILFGELPAGASQIYLYYGNAQASNTAIPEPFNNIADGTTGNIQAEESSQGPVAHWKFDEGYGDTAHNSTTNTLNGAITGAIWQAEDMCISGKCLYFDGVDDNVTILHDERLSSANFTLSFWLKVSSLSNKTGCCAAVVSKSSGAFNRNYEVYIHRTSGELYATSSFDGAQTDANSKVKMTDNSWKHVTYSVSGNNQLIYINGSLVYSFVRSGSADTQNADFVISGFGALHGAIDELKFYNYPRTLSQIQQDYVAGITSMKQQGGNLSDGLVGYWKMDEASWDGTPGEVKDSSGNGNDGTAVGGSELGVGRYGNGGSFDGENDYINVVDSPSLKPSLLTVAAWIKVDGIKQDAIFKGAGGGGWGDGWRLITNATTGTFAATVNTSTRVTTTAGAVTPNTWQHVAFAYDGSRIDLYVDGMKVGSGNQSGLINYPTNQAMYIGNSAGVEVFSGAIDEARLYGRALSSSEISQLYNYAPKPVGYWDFEEGSGNTVYDKSGNGNDGAWSGTGERYGSGKLGKAGKFNVGSTNGDYIDLGNGIDITRDGTLSAWVMAVGDVALGGSEGIIGNSQGFRLTQNDYSSQGVQRFDTMVADVSWTPTYRTIGYGPINKGEWYHLSAVREMEAGKLKLYVNGRLVGENTSVPIEILEDLRWYIGRRDNAIDFQGYIDEVKAYNYARTQQQIIEDMQTGQSAVNSPIGHWKFDEGQGAVARNSGIGGSVLDASLINMANPASEVSGWSKAGYAGGTVIFDAEDDRVETSATTILNGNQTYSAWVKTTSNAGTIVAHGALGDGSANSGVYIRTSGGKAQFNAADGSGFRVVVNGQTTITDDRWHQVVGVKGDDYVYLYVDGKLDGSQSIAGFTPSSGRVVMGSRGPMPTGYVLSGALDEVRAYNYALAPQDILVDYNQSSAMVAGNTSTEPTTSQSGQPASKPSNSAGSEYCVPGSDDYCAPPVGEWKFDEKSGSVAKDTSGGGHDGVINGADWTSGVKGSGLSFDGDRNYVNVNDSDHWDFATTGGTVQWWFKAAIDQSADYPTFIHHQNNPEGWTSWMGNASGRIVFSHRGSDSVYLSPIDDYRDNNWHHVSVVLDTEAEVASMYIDGLLVVTDTFSELVEGNKALEIGGRSGIGYTLNGSLDDFRIYNYSRTPAQIAWDYNKGEPVAHYRFDECQGGAIKDSSANALHGVLNLGSGGVTSVGTCDSLGAWSLGKSGKFGWSMSFDGVDDYAELPDLDLSGSSRNQVSVAGWAKRDNGSGTIFNYGIDTIKLFYGGNSPTCYVRNSSAVLATARVDRSGMAYQWEHLACTYDGSMVKLYVDGEKLAEAPLTGYIRKQEGGVGYMLGRGVSYPSLEPSNRINGQIDDVQIFNYALTDVQVKSLYNGGSVYWGE